MPGVSSSSPSMTLLLEPLHQRMHTETQLEIEHLRAVFDEQVLVAGLAIADRAVRARDRRNSIGDDLAALDIDRAEITSLRRD